MEIAQGSVIGNYRILMPLGKGGMGAVYEVEHENPGAVAWARASMTVTASFGYDRALVSYLYVSYGTESEPPVSCALAVQDVHFINEGDRPERVYPVSVSLICPVETNGVVDISHEGSDGALFWSDAAATQPLQSLSGISLSSVEEGSGGASYTFYMTSPNIGKFACVMWCMNSGTPWGLTIAMLSFLRQSSKDGKMRLHHSSSKMATLIGGERQGEGFMRGMTRLRR